MIDEKDEFKAATLRGKEALKAAPRAVKVEYKPRFKSLNIELISGVSVSIPVNLIQILADASPAEIADVKTSVQGLYLQWESLGEDLMVENLLRGVFGTRKWMDGLKEHLSAAGRKGGKMTTEAKRKASAANGRLGGRPRKTA
jgi:Protein of unknown function (DUF2442)